jgi:hypothetical protein
MRTKDVPVSCGWRKGGGKIGREGGTHEKKQKRERRVT